MCAKKIEENRRRIDLEYRMRAKKKEENRGTTDLEHQVQKICGGACARDEARSTGIYVSPRVKL